MTARRFRDDAPPPPAGDVDWPELLQWIVAAVPVEHDDISFAASLLHQAIDRPGLTEKQALWAQRMIDRLLEEWAARDCRPPAATDLTRMETRGRA